MMRGGLGGTKLEQIDELEHNTSKDVVLQHHNSKNAKLVRDDKKKISRLNSPKNELIEGKRLTQAKPTKLVPQTTTNRNRMKTNSEYSVNLDA